MDVKKAVDAGYSALNSRNWYFDSLGSSWEAMYTNDPTLGITSAASRARVLGGQGGTESLVPL